MSLDRWLNILLAVALGGVVMFTRLEARLMDASWMGLFRAEVQRTQDQMLRNQQELSRMLQELSQRVQAVESKEVKP